VAKKKKWAATRSAVNNAPPKSAYIHVGLLTRLRIGQCFNHFLATGRNLKVGSVWGRIAIILLASVAAGGVIYNFASAIPILSIPTAWRAVAAVLGSSLLFWFSMKAVGFFRHWVNNTSPLNANGLLKTFDKENAPRWAAYAANTLRYRANETVVEPLTKLHHDRETPYRILKGFAPVPSVGFYRPEKYRAAAISGSGNDALINIDALCGALLDILHARPEPRFTDGGRADDPVLQDYHWRYDAQQMPDSMQEDIFLRFHQSTVERPLRSACRFKTYAALNNFRKSPIHILRVKDVIDCLRDKDGEHSDHMDVIYKDLSLVSTDNIVETLMAQSYHRYPPRMARFAADSLGPTPGAILFENDVDDWKMLFDAARVWAQDGAEMRKYLEAIVALRRAIDLVAHCKAVSVMLDRCDVLVVNNLRVLVGRWEDRPALFPWRDSVASVFKPLEGRWLRQIYGFPAPTGAIVNPHSDINAVGEQVEFATEPQPGQGSERTNAQEFLDVAENDLLQQ